MHPDSHLLDNLGIEEWGEIWEKTRKFEIEIFLLLLGFWLSVIFILLESLNLIPFSDALFYAASVFMYSSIFFSVYLAEVVPRRSRGWKISSVKNTLFFMFLPLSVGLFLSGSISFIFIGMIMHLPYHMIIAFSLIFLIPLVFLALLIILLEDSYTLSITLSIEGERLVSLLTSAFTCHFKKAWGMGYWSADCNGIRIKIVPISTISSTRAKLVISNVKRKNAGFARKIIEFVNSQLRH